MNEINTTSGSRFPWAHSGVLVGDSSMGAEEVMREAGLDWKVEGRPLLFPVDSTDPAAMNMQMVHKSKAIVHDNAEMGIVGRNWRILQNHEVFEFVDELVGLGLVKYHSAGSFKEGRVIWVQAEFDQSEIVPGDVHEKFLLFANAFDGTFSVRIGSTDLRVFCMNMMAMATKNATRIQHTASMKDKLAIAKTALLAAQGHSHTWDAFQKALLKVHMNDYMWTDFSNTMIPDPPEGKNTTRAQNNRETLSRLFVNGRGQDVDGVRGTAYAALNAVTEYANYERTARGKTEEVKQASRFESTLFGASSRMIAQSVDVLNGLLVDRGIQVEC